MSNTVLLQNASRVIKLTPNNALIQAPIENFDHLFDFSLLSDNKFSRWRSIADNASKIGVVSDEGNETHKFIDSNFCDSIEGSLWFSGRVQQNYLQTGENLQVNNSSSVFTSSDHITSHGFHEVSGEFVDRCNNKSAIGTLVNCSQSGLLGGSCEFTANSVIEYASNFFEVDSISNITISILLKQTNIYENFDIILTKGSGLNIYTYNGIMYVTTDGLSYFAEIDYTPFVQNNTWYLLTLVFDGTQTDADLVIQNSKRIKIYVNDVLMTLSNFTGNVPATTLDSGYSLYLGDNTGYGFSLLGSIDETRIVLNSWSIDEVCVHYRQFFNQTTYWIATIQPVIVSSINLGNGRWRITGTGFVPESSKPVVSIENIVLLVESATDTELIVRISNVFLATGNKILTLENSDGEIDTINMQIPKLGLQYKNYSLWYSYYIKTMLKLPKIKSLFRNVSLPFRF